MFEEKRKIKKFWELKKNDLIYLINSKAMEVELYRLIEEKTDNENKELVTNRGTIIMTKIEWQCKTQLEVGLGFFTTDRQMVDSFIKMCSRHHQEKVKEKRIELRETKNKMIERVETLQKQIKAIEENEKNFLLTPAVERNLLRLKRF